MTNVPTRLLVLQRLTQHLEATVVDTDGGTLEGKVYRGRVLFGEESKAPSKLPMISIIEAPRPDAAVQHGGVENEMRKDGWQLLVQGLVEDDSFNPTDPAYHLEAAVEVQLAKIIATDGRSGDPVHPSDYLLGGLITHLKIGPPVVRPPEDKISATAFFFLPIWVGIATPVGQPYTSV